MTTAPALAPTTPHRSGTGPRRGKHPWVFHAVMTPITLLALSFAFVQGVLFSFSVTYLTERGMSLAEAGFAYACLQGAGVFARIFLGWLGKLPGFAVRLAVVFAHLDWTAGDARMPVPVTIAVA